MIFVDSHCHIDGEQFDIDREEVIRRAWDAGVRTLLNVGTGDPHSGEIDRAVEVAEKYENVFASIGVHPHDAKLYNDDAEQHLLVLSKSSKVIAWGEIGLDFYYDHSPREVQIDVFRRQVRTAIKAGLPIIIHSRDANDETVDLLRDECGDPNFVGGVMHCFGGTPEMAKSVLDLGFYISFAGNVTFKKADNLRDAVRSVPLDRMLVETDCPFLTPVPFRGKRNEPAYVAQTASFLADFLGVKLEELAKATTANFLRLFRLADANS